MSLVDKLKNFILAYGPIMGQDQDNKRSIKRAIITIRKHKRDLYDPISDSFKLEFLKIIEDMADISKRLRPVYQNNLNGGEEHEENFEKAVVSNILEKVNYTLEDLELKNIITQLTGHGSGGIKTVDSTFKERMKSFKHKDFKICNKYLNKNMVLADLVLFNYDNLINQFQFKSNGETYPVSGESIQASILDLYFLSGAIVEFERIVVDPIMTISLSYSEAAESYTYEHLTKDILRLYNIFDNILTNSFLEDLLCLISKDFNNKPPVKVYENTFPIDVYQPIIDKFRVDRQRYLQQEKNKVLNSRIYQLFEDLELLTCQVYSDENSNLFFDAGLPIFKYIETIRIIKSFYVYYFDNQISKSLKLFQVNAEYMHKEKQNIFNGYFESLNQVSEDIKKFEEDLTIPSFSKVDPYLKIIKNSILDSKTKLKAQDAIKFVNNEADGIIQALFESAIKMNAFITAINVDIIAMKPNILNNVIYFKNTNPELAKELEDCSDKLNKLVHLMRAFSVHLDKAKTNM